MTKSTAISLRLPPQALHVFRAAAEASHLTLSAWLLRAAHAAAQVQLDTERETLVRTHAALQALLKQD
jgi:uncharacterized protein (DUF1778 family)